MCLYYKNFNLRHACPKLQFVAVPFLAVNVYVRHLIHRLFRVWVTTGPCIMFDTPCINFVAYVYIHIYI